MKQSPKRPHYKQMCVLLYESIMLALRHLDTEDIERAKDALLTGKSACEMVYFESTFSSFDPKKYDFDTLISEGFDDF